MDGKILCRNLFLFPILLFTVACGSPVKSSTKGAAPDFSSGNGGGGSGSSPAVGEEPSDEAGFFLSLTSTSASVTLHQADVEYSDLQNEARTNFSEACKITTSDLSSATESDILCIAELEELDLFFGALSLQYHVPPSMCSYVGVMPYYFYGAEPGTGPSQVSYETQADGDIVDNSTQAGGGTSGGAAVCDYDYSAAGGANCCVGTYAITHTNYTVDPPETTTEAGQEWGGQVSACLFGPVTNWQFFNLQNFPLSSIAYVDQVGFNGTLDLSAAIDQDAGLISNAWSANFYDPDDHTDTAGIGSVPAGENADRPVPLRIPENVTGTDAYFPSDTFNFICYNRSQERKARIRLMIRDWNIANIAEGNDPNAIVDPAYPTDDANDRFDWKDFDDLDILYPTSYL